MFTHLWQKAKRSAALPVPSHTTTGTGGDAVTYSRTALIVFVPPSITKQTNGVENPAVEKNVKIVKKVHKNSL